MIKRINTLGFLALGMSLLSCGQNEKANEKVAETSDKDTTAKSEWVVDRFADIQVLRYKINSFDQLSTKQKALVYYLTQAGLSGRDMAWDQNFKYNLEIRTALENIYSNYKGDKSSEEWKNFETYLKRVWFSNGIHHHYGMNKMMPEFSKDYFTKILIDTKSNISPEAEEAMFSTTKYMFRKLKDASQDMIVASANNFYGDGVTQKMVDDFYSKIIKANDETP
ncbi:MAG: dihydrofolate reductase, partial [Crocinitomicaceae bacterium]